jgi:LuxR family maltose regulon positive regulatory protein
METGESLLLTKLFVPRVRPGRVARPTLLARLNQALSGKLTLVSAPAGFGKTTLVADWLQQVDRPSAWLSLSDGDNDPNRFLIYLTAALQRIDSAWGQTVQELLHTPQPPALTAMVVTLINDIAAGDSPFALVLDDYHLISAPSIHAALSFLLDNLPTQMHLVVLSRADPPLPLPRLRARGEVTEIRADELRFTLEESVAFLNEVMNLGLTQQQITVLESRTEGWVAGLQLAGISLQGLPRDDADHLIEAFAGSHRYVMDYLVEEVFDRQPRHVQQFLLQTSILDRLSGPLCDAILDEGRTTREEQGASFVQRPASGGQAILEYLEDHNLFTMPLDHERHWYRYHRLFADLLRDRMQQMQPEHVPDLHRRASAWYEQKGLADQAFAHAAAAGDVQRAVCLAEAHAERLVQRGDVATLLRWLEALPDQVVRSRPRLCVSYAWALFLTGQAGVLEPWLHDAETALAQWAALPSMTEDASDLAPLLDEVDVLRLASSRYRENPAGLIERYGQALDQMNESDLFSRGLLYLGLGVACRLNGDAEGAIHAYSEAAQMCQAAGNTMAAVIAIYDLSRMYGFQGRLNLAAKTCRQVLESDKPAPFTAQRSPSLGLIHLGLARVQYEWNELETAEMHTRAGLALGEPGGSLVLLMRGYTLLARIRHACGDGQGVRESLRTLEWAIEQRELTQATRDEMAAYRALFDVMLGDLETPARWAGTIKPTLHDKLDTLREFQWLILVRVLITQRLPDEAAPLLRYLLQTAESEGRTGRAIEILALQALALQAQARPAQALSALKKALSLGEPEGYVRTFVDEGVPMATLLRRALAQGIAPNYVRRLLAAFDEPVAGSALVEPLTRRELEVLRLIADGLKNREIADHLVISVATVKRHITNIYGKLDVSRRVQAVARAQDLGLL